MSFGRNRFPWSLLGAAVFLYFLWRLDFPPPGFDDLFYTGAALNLAGGGDFSNPLLARQGFPSHYFFVYPPLHSHVLAGWLKLFGISSATQTGFVMLNLLVICVATVAILRQRQAPGWLEWLVPLGVVFGIMPAGLRTEPLAVALTLSGFALAERGGSSLWRQLTGFFLLFLGASCAPRVTIFAGALALGAGCELWRGAADQAGRRNICACWLAGLAGAGLVFLILIDFHLKEFLVTFHFHASRTPIERFAILADFAKHILGILQWPLILLPLALLADALRKPGNASATLGVCIAGAAILTVFSGALGGGGAIASIWWAIFMMFILVPSFVKSHSPLHVARLKTVIVLVLLVANRKLFVQCYGLLSGKIDTKMRGEFQTASVLRPTPEHPLLVDGAVARYVFDYRLPAGFLDVEFGAPFPGGLPGELGTAELRPGDIFITGPTTRVYLAHHTYLQPDNVRWSLWGFGSFGFEKFPRQIYVFPATDCKASRPLAGETPVTFPKDAK